MGTLFNQPPRDLRGFESEDVEKFIKEAKLVSKRMNIPLMEVFRAYELLELHKRNLTYVDNGNIFDEQMMGFGELLKDFIQKMDLIAMKVDERL
jgi:hypothetical protein